MTVLLKRMRSLGRGCIRLTLGPLPRRAVGLSHLLGGGRQVHGSSLEAAVPDLLLDDRQRHALIGITTDFLRAVFSECGGRSAGYDNSLRWARTQGPLIDRLKSSQRLLPPNTDQV